MGVSTDDMIKKDFFPSKAVPLTRAGHPDEVAGTLIYMASFAGGYNNGSLILVDGGSLSMLPNSTH
jgi:NAD(P)-dependent dehydrogenase (short-subunit alcohol dehydrogenase family)